MALSAHKTGGPQGVGALLVKEGAPFSSLVTGGGQEKGARAGTENVAGIAGYGVAAEIVKDTWQTNAMRVAGFRDDLERQVLELSPDSQIFSGEAPRLPNTSNFSLPNVRSDTQVMNLDLADIAVSAGSACSAGKVDLSHVLEAMGIGSEIASTAIRVSFGWNSKSEDVRTFISVWQKMIRGALGQETAA